MARQERNWLIVATILRASTYEQDLARHGAVIAEAKAAGTPKEKVD